MTLALTPDRTSQHADAWPQRAQASFARVAHILIAAFVTIAATVPAAVADEPLKLQLDGAIEPRQRVEIANQITGVVSGILVTSGQKIEAGQPMFELDSEPYKLDVAAARAELEEARAKLRLAEDITTRQTQLTERGVGARARTAQASFETEAARAAVSKQETALARAELMLKRTRILAPISGTVGKLRVAVGAFVEAEGGTVLGDVVQLDPVLVAYQVPYADRQAALAKSGAKAARTLFAYVDLRLELPSGQLYVHKGTPLYENATVDPATGTLTTWAEFPNPEGSLVPGLKVRVLSNIHDHPQRAETPE